MKPVQPLLAPALCAQALCSPALHSPAPALCLSALSSTRSTIRIPVLILGSRLLIPFDMTMEASQAVAKHTSSYAPVAI